MKLISTGSKRSTFNVLHATAGAQAAMMTLRPGQSTSDHPENEHPRCEQWLLVLRGSGKARVGKRTVSLKANSLLLIEESERHQISNTGRSALITFNVYVPPAYTKEGDPRLLARVPTIKGMLKRT